MNDDRKFNLPGSGYDVLTKILHAYAVAGDGKIALGVVSAKSGLSDSMVSRNNGFLVSLGILEGGRAKSLTDVGKPLAIAIGNSIVEDIRSGWKTVLASCPATKSILDMVKIQKGVSKDDFPSRIASSLGLVTSDATKTGLNTLIELFEKSEILEIREGKYQLQEDVNNNSLGDNTADGLADEKAPSAPTQQMSFIPPQEPKEEIKPPPIPSIANNGAPDPNQSGSTVPSLHIDLQIHISPEATPDQIDQVFASIAKHLYNKEDE